MILLTDSLKTLENQRGPSAAICRKINGLPLADSNFNDFFVLCVGSSDQQVVFLLIIFDLVRLFTNSIPRTFQRMYSDPLTPLELGDTLSQS